jgi:hypothetical protein
VGSFDVPTPGDHTDLEPLHGGDMKYHVLSTLLLAVAVALEVAGTSGAGALLLGAGVACEVWFWIRLVRGRSRRPRSPSFEV